jgi:hypothetical protein
MSFASDLCSAHHLATRIWSSMQAGLALRSDELCYHPKAFCAEWLQSLPLPIGKNKPASQVVALVGRDQPSDKSVFRTSDPQKLAAAYNTKPRTRVYESTEVRSGSWLHHLSRLLETQASCRVICTLYESCAVDEPTPAHHDTWFGALVQLRGTKGWRFGDNLQQELVTECGDLLLLPGDVRHAVWTPDNSVHLVCAFLANK